MIDSLTRRGFLASSTLATTALAFGLPARAADTKALEALKGDGSVVVCTWGGRSNDIMREIWFDPFAKFSGIEVSLTSVPDVAKLEVMQKASNVEWDMIDCEGTQLQLAARKGLLQPIDYKLIFSIVPEEQLNRAVLKEYGIGSVAFSTVIAWNTKLFGHDGPKSWAEFFDTTKFKGRRAIYSRPRPSLEIALMAAGVPKDKIYPINLDEAFAALDEIKPKVDLWVEQSSQWSLLMQNSEVDLMASGLALTMAEKIGGTAIDYNFDQSIVEQSYWTIPKGAPNAKSAQKLIAWMMQAEGMRAHALRRPVEVANTSIYKDIPQEAASQLPGYPANAAKNMHIDEAWWSENNTAVQARWLDWVSKL